jgi:hypothetical protein
VDEFTFYPCRNCEANYEALQKVNTDLRKIITDLANQLEHGTPPTTGAERDRDDKLA